MKDSRYALPKVLVLAGFLGALAISAGTLIYQKVKG